MCDKTIVSIFVNPTQFNNKKIYFYDIYNKSKESQKQNSFPNKAIDYLRKLKNKDKKIFDLPNKISNRSKAFKLWKKKAGIINNKTFHDARHTFAYKIYNKTKNIYLVAEKLGHKNVEITKKYYADMKKSLDQDIDYLEKSYNIKSRQNTKKKSQLIPLPKMSGLKVLEEHLQVIWYFFVALVE